MKRFVAFGFVALLLVSAPGCGGGGADSLMKELISLTNEQAAAMEKKEPADKIKAIEEKLKATDEKFKALKLSEDELQKLLEKYGKEMAEAMTRLAKASLGDAAFKELVEGEAAALALALKMKGTVDKLETLKLTKEEKESLKKYEAELQAALDKFDLTKKEKESLKKYEAELQAALDKLGKTLEANPEAVKVIEQVRDQK